MIKRPRETQPTAREIGEAGDPERSVLASELAVYNAGLAAATPLLAGYLGWRVLHGKSREGWRERWGNLPPEMRLQTRPGLWVHAASVGEVGVARPILAALRESRPDLEAVMTVITPGGYEVAQSLVGKLVRHVAYLPFDLLPLVRRAVEWIRPDLFVGIETEIWPNLLDSLRRSGVRAVLVNARISDRSFPRYRKARWLMRWALRQYDRVLAQSEEDARRFAVLGAEADRLATLGNVKFDEAEEPLPESAVLDLRRELGIRDGEQVWVIGSTRSLAEEQLVWQAYRALLQRLPGVVLIHAPRHVERADAVESGLRQMGFTTARRSSVKGDRGDAQVIILDTFGELGRIYAVGDVAFIGNSLTPPGGGQNLLQPLAQGKPVLFGPYMNNFRDAVDLAAAAGVGIRVDGPEKLAAEVCRLLQDREARQRIASDALDLVRRHRGTARRYAEVLLAALPPGEP
ncbi:MAG: 3-deoxy-D-manno-octulosonic acid transferase [Chthonomonadales bacterium]|nr:3-deoxy-D-manno-octulosonic acid transferase [Chthonomonadales bacterium]